MMTEPGKLRQTYIRQWRQHRHLTLQELAKRMDTTHSYLSMLERGQRSYNQRALEGLASALRTDVAALLIGDPTDPDAIWAIWDKAKPDQRERITAAAKKLVKGPRSSRR